MEAIDVRKEVHEEIDRMTDHEVRGLKEYMATFPNQVTAAFRNAPFEDECVSEEAERLVAEAEEWLKQKSGKSVPDEEIVREFGPV